MAAHLCSEVRASCDDDLMTCLARGIHERQHRVKMPVERVGGEQHAHVGQSTSG